MCMEPKRNYKNLQQTRPPRLQLKHSNRKKMEQTRTKQNLTEKAGWILLIHSKPYWARFQEDKNREGRLNLLTAFCMQVLSAKNSFSHIPFSTAGNLVATHWPYSFIYRHAQRKKHPISTPRIPTFLQIPIQRAGSLHSMRFTEPHSARYIHNPQSLEDVYWRSHFFAANEQNLTDGADSFTSRNSTKYYTSIQNPIKTRTSNVEGNSSQPTRTKSTLSHTR